MTAALASARTAGREFAFSAADFDAISKIVRQESGIVLPASKQHLVYARLAKRIRACDLDSFSAYLQLIQRDPEERARAIDALTTNHTKFFREQHHFKHLARDVWPALWARLNGGGRVRLWSAACSTGEEPCSIAMAVAGRDPGAAAALSRTNFRILATDLSSEALEIARTGVYAAQAMDEVPPELRDPWLKRHPHGVEVHPGLRALISYRQLNFFQQWPTLGQFDVIFCRNAMIYFDEPSKAALQRRLVERLAVGGHLYIGHSERIAADILPMLEPIGQTGFRRVR